MVFFFSFDFIALEILRVLILIVFFYSLLIHIILRILFRNPKNLNFINYLFELWRPIRNHQVTHFYLFSRDFEIQIIYMGLEHKVFKNIIQNYYQCSLINWIANTKKCSHFINYMLHPLQTLYKNILTFSPSKI